MDSALITRRGLLAGATAASLIRPKLAQAQTTGIIPIFINWNAWYDNTELVTRQFHWQLSPERWQFRAPFFCEQLGPEKITCAGTQASMDIEIQAAAQAGLKAWTWVWYGPTATGLPVDQGPGNAALHKGWEMYNTSTQKNTLKWCARLGISAIGADPWTNTSVWQANCNYWIDHFKETNYLKLGTRPVVTLVWQQSRLSTHFANSTANTVTACNYLRSQSVAAGAGDPYILCEGDPWGNDPTSAEAIDWVTGDAITHYIPRLLNNKLPNSFADLAADCRKFWDQDVATGKKMALNTTMGWDVRPLVELPQYQSGRRPWFGRNNYYVRGTNFEIANHLQEAIDYIGAHQPQCDNKILLVYAWNECAEGGTTGIPTLGDPPTGSPPTTGLLSAIKPVLTAAA